MSVTTFSSTPSVRHPEPSSTPPGYIVEIDGVQVAFEPVGNRAVLERHLAARGHRSWALIGAANPYTLRLEPAQNDERAACLRRLLQAAGFSTYVCRDLRGWVGILVADIPTEAAADWGRDFAQSSIWWSEIGGTPVQCPCEPLSFEI